MIREVVLATTNKGKLRDFRALLAGSGIELRLPEEFGVRLDVDETGTTFRENALLKARAFAAAIPGVAVLSDDSGLAVEALGGKPGVYSARYAGEPSDDGANNRKVLEEMRDVADRGAAFVVVLALVLANGEEVVVEGRCEGTVAFEERGANGFGYDAIFYREDLGRTFGEAEPAEKNARSHRAAAVRALLEALRERRDVAPLGATARAATTFVTALALCLVGATGAEAHTTAGVAGGFASGFLHPIAGPDHVIAMVAVGLWGAFLGQPAIWVLPVVFPMVMSFGGALGVAGVPLPGVEVGIALSAIVLGAMVAMAARPPLWIAAVIVGAFAVFHGHAHGTELPNAASPLAYSLGFVVSTGLLHLGGIAFGMLAHWPAGRVAVRAGGAAIALGGLAFLMHWV